jgi:L-lactate utilization protein LutC
MIHPVLARVRARVREAVARATLPEHDRAHPGGFAWDTPAGSGLEQRVSRFTRELEPLGGTIHRVPSVAAAREAIVTLIVRDGTPDVLAWDEADVGVAGLSAALREAGARLVDQQAAEGPGREACMAALGACEVGLTGADFGLADTGSLVLVSGEGRGRLASLLPPVHIAVLPVSRLVWTLADVFAAAPDLATRGSNLAVITGPSRTADIEMTLTRGVHGPRDVHVVLIG